MDYVKGELLVDPTKMTVGGFKDPGRFFGVALGWFIEHRFIRFDTDGTPYQKTMRCLVGALLFKGKYNHNKAVQVTEYYKCSDPYASTEMEDVAIVSVADRFGLLDRTLVMRVAVNIDVFYDGATPESLWGQNTGFIDTASENNEETLDIFTPGMENLFCVARTVIDSILNEEF